MNSTSRAKGNEDAGSQASIPETKDINPALDPATPQATCRMTPHRKELSYLLWFKFSKASTFGKVYSLLMKLKLLLLALLL